MGTFHQPFLISGYHLQKAGLIIDEKFIFLLTSVCIERYYRIAN